MRHLFVLLLSFASLAANADVFPDAPHIYVEGSAEIRVEPDTLELSLVIEATDPQLAPAKASVDERSQKLIAACKKLGIEDADLISTSLQFGPAYDYSGRERKLIGTQVRRPIGVRLRDLEKYSGLIQAIVAAKVDQIDSTMMTSSNGAKTLQEAQQAALADARARAERFAAAAGQQLGDAYSISEFDHRARERYELLPARGFARDRGVRASRIADSGDEPFEPGTIVATATVYVIYLLEDD
jgi:uncharacterized protein YggE